MGIVKLKELVDIYLGVTHTPEYVFKGVPFLSVKDISDGEISFEDCKYISQEEYDSLSEGAKPKVGDMLFCRVGTLGKPIIIPEGTPLFGSFVSLGYLRNKNSDRCDMNYLRYWMNSNAFWQQVNANVKGASQVNLNTGWLSKFDVDLPSLEEQRYRISILDQCSRILKYRKEQLEGIDNIIKARFVELFGDPKLNPKKWDVVNISEVVGGKVSNGFFAKRDDYCDDGNIRVLGVANIVNRMYSNLEDLPRTNADDKDIEKFEVKYGDMLFCRSSLVAEGIGKASIIPEDVQENILFECHVIRLPLDLSKCVPEFIQTLSTMDYFRNQVISQSKTATMTTIGQDGILKTDIILPPIDKQKEFYDFVKQVDKSKVVVQKALNEAQTLFNSLMQGYFE